MSMFCDSEISPIEAWCEIKIINMAGEEVTNEVLLQHKDVVFSGEKWLLVAFYILI